MDHTTTSNTTTSMSNNNLNHLVPEKKSQHFTIPVQYLHCSGSGGSDSTKGGLSNPYLKEVYRKHLEEKQN